MCRLPRPPGFSWANPLLLFPGSPRNRMKVSVVTVTYNQERFIAEAIESVLMQETNFDYELVLAEDLSTDGTRDIVKRWAADYPGKIRAILNDRNMGMALNF